MKWTGLNTLVVLVGLAPFAVAQDAIQGPPLLDVSHYDIAVEIVPGRSYLKGMVTVRLTVLEQTLFLPFDFNRKLSVIAVSDEAGLRYSMSADSFASDRLKIEAEELFRPGDELTLIFEFDGTLEREQYAFLDLPFTGKALVDPNGALLLSEGYWFPSHRLELDAATAEVKVTVPLGFSAVAPGQLGPIQTVGISEQFVWQNAAPITRLPLVVARFFRQKVDDGPVPITFFVTEEFDADLEPIADVIGGAVEFMQQRYQPSPLQSLTIVEVAGAQVGSSGARGLLLFETETLQRPALPVMSLARRVAEQWWGHSLRFQRSFDAWLRDGFATFSALQYMRSLGAAEYERELARLAVEALKHQEKAPIVRGLELEVGSPQYESIIAAKGAWVLNMLGQLIGEEKLFGLLEQWYRTKAEKTGSIPEFAALVQQNTEDDYGWFFSQWIESIGVPEFQVDYTIYKVRAGGFRIRGQVKQNLDLFKMPLDVLIETRAAAEEKRLMANGKSTSFTFETETTPVRIEIDPKGKVLMDSQRMRIAVHVAMGDEYSEAGEFVSAIAEYEKAVDLNPRSSLAHFRLGEVFFQQFSYSNAANSFRDTLNGDLKPDWVETWTHIYLGKVYDVLGQRQRALAEYQKAINSQVDYNGAQAEAKKYLEQPYTKPSSVLSQSN